MNDYYEKRLSEIKQLIEDKAYDKACFKLEEELVMPYIPSDVQTEFEALHQSVLYALNDPKTQSLMSIEQIEEELLKNDSKLMYQALESLSKYHLKNHIDLFEKLFKKPVESTIVSMLILMLIEQEVDEEFELIEPMQIVFNPLYIVHPLKSDGFIEAHEWIEKMTFKNPIEYQQAIQVLVSNTVKFLPMTYEKEEGKMLGFSVMRALDEMLDQLPIWDQRVKEFGIDEAKLFENIN